MDVLKFYSKTLTGQVVEGDAYTAAKTDALLSKKQDALIAGINIGYIFGTDPTKTNAINALGDLEEYSSMPVASSVLYKELEKKTSSDYAEFTYAKSADVAKTNGCVSIFTGSGASIAIQSSEVSKYALIVVIGTMDDIPFSATFRSTDLIAGKQMSAACFFGSVIETAAFTYLSSENLLSAVEEAGKKMDLANIGTAFPNSSVLITKVYGILESSASFKLTGGN